MFLYVFMKLILADKYVTLEVSKLIVFSAWPNMFYYLLRVFVVKHKDEHKAYNKS